MKNTSLIVLVVLSALTSPLFAKQKTVFEVVKASVSETLIAPPVDDEVCFSPEGNCDVKLWKFIQQAQKSLDIAIFDLTHPKITHEILVASKRIPVRVVVDRRQSKGQHSLISTLVKGGVPVRLGTQRGIMHNKFTIVDQTRLETGSFNYSDGASTKNNENQVYLANPKIVAEYQKRFEHLWEEAKPISSTLSSIQP